MLLLHRLKHSLNLIGIRYVTRQREGLILAKLGCGRFQRFLIASGDDHMAALLNESAGQSQSNPAAAAGDDGNLIFQHLLLWHLEGISVLSIANERQELLTRILRVAEAAQHVRSHGCRVLLFHATHHHAQVPRLNHHAYTLGLDCVLNRLRDLHCKTLLHLQAASKNVYDAWNLAQTEDSAVGNVGYVDFTEERQ